MLKKRHFVLVFTFVFLCFLLNFVSASTPGSINTCQTLDTSGVYTMTGNANASSTCFTLTQSNITLDCAWFNVTYGTGGSSGFGVNTSNSVRLSNLTIENCKFFDNSSVGTDGYGFFFNNVSDSLATNLTLSVNSSLNGYGMYILSSTTNNFSNINVFGTSKISANHGVYLSSSNSNTFNNFNISINGTSTNYALYLASSSSNIFSNFNISTNGTDTNYGVYFQTSNSNTLSNFNVTARGTTSGNIGVYFQSANFNTLSNFSVRTLGTSGDYGVYLTNTPNPSTSNTLSNFLINTNGTSNNNGLYLSTANSNTFSDFNITTQGSSTGNAGLLISSGNSNSFSKFNITATGNSTTNYGINIVSSSSNTLSNFLINTNGSTSNYGIFIQQASTSNTLSNFAITTSATNTTNTGIVIQQSSLNVISNMTINSTNSSSLIIFESTSVGSSNNNFTDVLFQSYSPNPIVNITNATGTGLSTGNNFINVTYPTANESVTTGNQLTRWWYLNVNATDQGNTTLTSVTINGTNISSNLQFSEVSSTNGSIGKKTLIEYVNNGGTRQYYTSYNISGTKSNFRSGSTILNLTNSTSISLLLIDNTVPNITSIIFTPNDSDRIDPYVNITFNATINPLYGIASSVILVAHNGTNWFNTSMYRVGSTSVYQANLTMVNIESNYTFKIYANDSWNNINQTDNRTFSSLWDCTWNITNSSFGTITGFNQNKILGNITINNTGDSSYATNNCTLSFHLTQSLTAGRIYFNHNSNNQFLTYYDTSSINAGSILGIVVNGSYLSTVSEDPYVISVDDIGTVSSTNASNMSGTLLSSTNSPYLSQSVTESTTSIYLTEGNYSFTGSFQDVAANGTITTTAFNVSANWTLTSDFTIKDGNSTLFLYNITNTSTYYVSINVSFNSTNLPSMTAGSQQIYFYTMGYNSSNSLISNANNLTLLTSTVNITFSCYNVSDNIAVKACGSLDPDNPASVAAGVNGGGGGGGAAAGGSSSRSSEELQLVRGKQSEIKVVFRNNNGATPLTDLSFSLSGKISKYIAVSPATWDYLGPGESMTLTLKVLSPTYIELGTQNLDILVSGKLGSTSYSEIKDLLLQVQDISPAEAKELIAQDKVLIAKLTAINLSIDNLNKLLKESEDGLANFNYAKIIENHATIEKNVNAALDASKIIKDIQALISDSKARGISTTGSERLIKLAELSLQRGDYEDAISRAKEAQVTYALEVKGEFSTVGYYLKNNTREIALGILFLAIFSFGGYKLTQLQLINNKIRKLKEEEKILTELVKALQIETFREGKMDLSEYGEAMNQYEKRMVEVVENLIENENKKANILHLRSEASKLQKERENMVDLIKALQTDYLKKGTIENKVYEFKLDSYNRRIAEIDKRMATREAEKALKGFNIFKKQ